MINVLNITSDSNIGGAGRCILTFLKYFDRNSFNIKVVVPTGSLLIPEIEKLGVSYIEAEGLAEKSLCREGIKNLKKIIRSENCDIVHTHGNMSGRIAGKCCGKKVVYTRHSVFPVSKRISRGIGKQINKLVNEHYADDIIAVAEAAKDNLTEGGISPEKVKVILNGVEQQKRADDVRISEIKQKYGIGADDFVVGILARIEEVKGHKYLIEATEKIVKTNPNLKVLIIGTGAIEGDLKKLVSEKGLENNIIFTGFITNVSEILSILDIQANASFGTEATSLSLLEGMSLGIPAVVSNYGGNPGVITNGENGYIFNKCDSEDMAKYLLKAMTDKKAYEYMQKRCVEIFNEKFTADIYARNIENIYKGLKGCR